MEHEDCNVVEREDGKVVEEMSIEASVAAVEKIVRYRFKNKALLEEALTHKSYNKSASYERLEFFGDAVLGLAMAKFLFTNYPNLDQCLLTDLRSANVDTENLARVAVRHDLYRYVRRGDSQLNVQVKKFAQAVQEEGDELPLRDLVNTPKILADIVESIAGAVFVDCNYDLERLWDCFSHLLEPIVTLEGYLMGSGCSEEKDIAKINAVTEALQNLLKLESTEMEGDTSGNVVNGEEIAGAKKKLNELRNVKRWLKPSYRTVKEDGPPHDRRFICSVQIYTKEGIYVTKGDRKPRVRHAENSAASKMLYGLQNSMHKVVLIPW